MMKMTLIVVENGKDHAEAKTLIEKLLASDDPRVAVRLAAQARLVEDYERRRWPRRVPAVAEVLSYLMDQNGLSRADLVPLLGTESRVSEVLSGKRGLSMSMIQRLRERFSVSADVLLPRVGLSRRRIAA